VASGVPRLDYYTSGGTAGCPALLVEASAQNVALRSAGMEVSGTWQRSNISVTTGITSPEGLATAFEIVESSDVTAQTHELAQSGLSVVSGTSYTFSLFIKAGTNNRNLRLAFGSANFVGSPVATFNPVSGSVVASGDCVASVENYGNGWFRCRMTATADVAGTSFFGVYPTSGTAFSYIGNGSGSVQVWGAQVEASSIATSYIPTTTAAVTRNADVVTLSGAVSGCIGQTEGTIYWDIAAVGGVLTGTGNPEFGVRNEAFTNWIGLTSNGTANPFRITARTTAGSSLINYQVNIASGKAALAWSSAGLVLYVNGVSVATSATNPNFSFSRADIGNTSTMPFKANAFALYTTRLTNAELAALTT